MSETKFFPGALVGDSSLSHGSGYRPRVLVVDDESMIADTVTKILSLSGYAATATYDGEDALETALLVPPQLLITDVMLPGMNGVELAITIKRIYPDCKILLFSGQAATADLMVSAKRAGHYFTLLSKPMPPQDLLAAVAKHLPSDFDPENAAVA
jgi:CheY-like chemotaxis protein